MKSERKKLEKKYSIIIAPNISRKKAKIKYLYNDNLRQQNVN